MILGSLGRASRSAGLAAVTSRQYRGDSDWLLIWGPGAPDRWRCMAQQIARGGHAIALDLAYWQRDLKFRVSIDAPHPQQWVMMRAWPDTRLVDDRLVLRSTWNRFGPVILAGLGRKAGVQYGTSLVAEWEAQMARAALADGRDVRYRSKRQATSPPIPLPVATAEPIDRVVQGASAVITWHSNVAVDAIRLGVPALCRDGAAAAVCGATWQPDLVPLEESVRRRFLANLAWFQWAPSEAEHCWRFLRDLLT